ncbi:MAG: hypothetical protein IT323_09235 [Anaerolineae bacterium]|nr:hypothetical protein [Anaerolineae bacterium]
MRFELPAEDEPAFPALCHCCGRAAEVDRKLSLSRLVVRGKSQEAVTKQYTIPLCARCGRADDRIALMSWASALLGMIVISAGTFVALLYLQGVLQRAGINLGYGEVISERGNGLLILAGMALIAGILGGGVIEGLLKLLAVPFLGRALYWAPFLLRQVFGDVAYVAGLTGKFTDDGRRVQLRFFNPAVGRAFAQENDVKPADG